MKNIVILISGRGSNMVALSEYKRRDPLRTYRIELVASEPQIVSPVAMDIDEHGRLFVVEMRDYPYPEEKNAAPTEFSTSCCGELHLTVLSSRRMENSLQFPSRKPSTERGQLQVTD